jgi:hypothetical protein
MKEIIYCIKYRQAKVEYSIALRVNKSCGDNGQHGQYKKDHHQPEYLVESHKFMGVGFSNAFSVKKGHQGDLSVKESTQ